MGWSLYCPRCMTVSNLMHPFLEARTLVGPGLSPVFQLTLPPVFHLTCDETLPLEMEWQALVCVLSNTAADERDTLHKIRFPEFYPGMRVQKSL